MRVLLAIGVLGILLGACSREPDLIGRWRTAPPASITYEIRRDQSILLYQHGQIYQVFRYKILDENTLQLFDGMGRIRQLDFEVVGDELRLTDMENTLEIWKREKKP